MRRCGGFASRTRRSSGETRKTCRGLAHLLKKKVNSSVFLVVAGLGLLGFSGPARKMMNRWRDNFHSQFLTYALEQVRETTLNGKNPGSTMKDQGVPKRGRSRVDPVSSLPISEAPLEGCLSGTLRFLDKPTVLILLMQQICRVNFPAMSPKKLAHCNGTLQTSQVTEPH